PVLRHLFLNPKDRPGEGRRLVSREINRYRLSFGVAVAACLAGYLVLWSVERTAYAPLALLSGISGCIGFIWLVSFIWDELDKTDLTGLEVLKQTWFALTFWNAYDFNETQAAGIFRLPTKVFRPGRRRVQATTFVLGALSIPTIQAIWLACPIDIP